MRLRPKAVAIVMLAAAGCGPPPASAPTSAPPTVSPTPHLAVLDEVHLREIASIDRGTNQVVRLSMDGNCLAWTEALPPALPTRAMRADISGGGTATILQAASGGEIDDAECGHADGDYVAAVSYDHELSDAAQGSPWRLTETAVSSGAVTTIATGTSTTYDDAPSPASNQQWIIWTQAHGGTFDLLAHRYGTAGALVVTSGLHSPFPTTDGSNAFVADNSPAGHDIYELPLQAGARPVQLTSGGNADFPNSANGSLVWQEGQGDPGQIMFMKLTPGGTPRMVGTGDQPRTSGPYVVWLPPASNFLHIRRESASGQSSDQTIQLNDLSTAARWALDGSRLALATQPLPGGHAVIHVFELS